MQQQISVITLGITDPDRSRRFYCGGFGWTPVFQNEEIIFFQMNGFVFGLFMKDSQDADMGRKNALGPAAFALAHNVSAQGDVEPLMARLTRHGGSLISPASAPPHGGYRGYVADPDGHAWEIAHNPAWRIGENGHVTFGT